MLEQRFFRILILVALADWLITRSLNRAAVFMPKTPELITIFRGLTWIGQYASILCALLVLFGIGWLAWRLRSWHGGLPSLWIACLGILSLALLLPVMGGWIVLASQLLALVVVILLGVRAVRAQNEKKEIALLVPAAAVWIGLVPPGGGRASTNRKRRRPRT